VLSSFVRYSREEWRRLRSAAPLSFSEAQARELQQSSEHGSFEEMSEVYLPVSWLLSLHVAAMRNLYQAAHAFFLGKEACKARRKESKMIGTRAGTLSRCSKLPTTPGRDNRCGSGEGAEADSPPSLERFGQPNLGA
jgi:pantothenate kinase